MALFTERLAILIDADGRGAIREIEKVGDTAERELSRAGGASSNLSASFMRAGALTVGASVAMGVGLYKAAQAFDEANAAQLRLENSLKNNPRLAGESITAYQKLANTIQQKTAADGDQVIAGMAMLGTFQVTGQQLRTLTPLVVDYARKFGVDLVDANAAVGKALDGQVGALKRNGVTIDETAFAADRFSAVQEALRSQVGGFANAEGKTFNGQLERMRNNLGDVKESIGAGVVASFNKLVGPLNSVVGGFKGLDSATGGTLGQLASFATVGGGTVGALLLIAGAAMKAKNFVGDLVTTFPRLAAAIGTAMPALGILTAVFAAGYVISQFTGKVEDLSESIRKMGRAADENQVKLFLLATGNMMISKSMSFADASLQTFKRTAEDNVGTAQRLIDNMRAAGMNTDKYEQALRREIAAQQQSSTDRDRGNQLLRDENSLTMEAYNNKLALLNAQLGLTGANLNAASAIERYNQVSGDVNATELEKAQALQSVDTAFMAVAASAIAAAEKQKGSSLTAQESADAVVNALNGVVGTLAPDSPLRQHLQAYIDKLKYEVPSNVKTVVSLSANFTEWDAYINGLTTVPGRAVGGPVTSGRPYVVGENGPELFVPGASGTIIPNGPMAAPTALAAGGSTTINLVVDGRVLSQIVRDDLIQIGRANGSALGAFA